jgi:hypothetical protein
LLTTITPAVHCFYLIVSFSNVIYAKKIIPGVICAHPLRFSAQ